MFTLHLFDHGQCNRRNASVRTICPLRGRILAGIVLAALLASLPQALYGMPVPAPPATEKTLPDSPGAALYDAQAPATPQTASISGLVLDIHEGIVPDAHITLEAKDSTALHETTSDSAGIFNFPGLPAGTYKVRISSDGLETFESYAIVLRNGEHYELPKIALPIAATSSEVTVTVTENQLAEEQIHEEMKQRTLGVFPNFYTSFLWNAAPLKSSHKFQLALRSSIDPMAFLTSGIIAGIQQARGTYAGYGDGPEGYAKRFGADYGNVVIGRMIGSAILPSLFRQDPRYFYQGSGTIPSRAWHAISSAIVCRGDNGRLQPNYSHVLGNFAAGGISNLYRPDADRGARLAIDNALIHTGANAFNNLVREFVLRGITTKVPTYAKGKPNDPPPTPAVLH